MHPLTRRIALLASAFALVLGLFLLGSNIGLIPTGVREVAVGLWPLILIVAGILLVVDSLRKRRAARGALSGPRTFPLLVPPEAGGLLCRVSFSYGGLRIAAAQGAAALVSEQPGSSGEPAIQRETRGDVAVLGLALSKTFFPSAFQLHNRWNLGLPMGLPVALELALHETDLTLDLRLLRVESLDVRADSGEQKILVGSLQKKLAGQIYCSAGKLAITLPSLAYVRVIMANPFCRIDYPQGDFERREDGSFVSVSPGDPQKSVEIAIDGPIKTLVLDVEDEGPAET
jgi:hypothetical protein